MGKINKVCPNCGKKMKQRFIGLLHCKCGISQRKGSGFFERDSAWSLRWRKMQKANRNW